STEAGPRPGACADTVAFAPGGFESIVTSWYGPWINVAQPLSAPHATASNIACRVMRNPLPSGRDATPGRPGWARSSRVVWLPRPPHPRTLEFEQPYLAFPSTVS